MKVNHVDILWKYYPKFITSFLQNQILLRLWIANGILKLLKPKQKLFENFLKNCIVQNESNYRKLFETIKRKFKKVIFKNMTNNEGRYQEIKLKQLQIN